MSNFTLGIIILGLLLMGGAVAHAAWLWKRTKPLEIPTDIDHSEKNLNAPFPRQKLSEILVERAVDQSIGNKPFEGKEAVSITEWEANNANINEHSRESKIIERQNKNDKEEVLNHTTFFGLNDVKKPASQVEQAQVLDTNRPFKEIEINSNKSEMAQNKMERSWRRNFLAQLALDPLIDCIVVLNMEHAVNAQRIQSVLSRSRRIGSKPWLVEGYLGDQNLSKLQKRQPNTLEVKSEGRGIIPSKTAVTLDQAQIVSDFLLDKPVSQQMLNDPHRIEPQFESSELFEISEMGHWEPLNNLGVYKHIQVGIQLANRTGAMSELDYSEFIMMVQSAADALHASVDFPDMREQIQNARELDQFASVNDVQVKLHLRAIKTPWSISYVEKTAENLGFQKGSIPGCMALVDTVNGLTTTVLHLRFDEQIANQTDLTNSVLYGVSIHWDITLVPKVFDPFEKLKYCLKTLEQKLEAELIDDAGQLLNNATFGAIEREVEKIYAALDMREIYAGSMLAKRLFS